MIKANHPEAGYFTEYIYTHDKEKLGNFFDIYLNDNPSIDCHNKSPDGFHCEDCYKRGLNMLFRKNNTFLKMKKFLTYQIGLYDNPDIWIRDLRNAMEYDRGFRLGDQMRHMIFQIIDEITEVEAPQADLVKFVSITNNFEGARIGQLNLTNGFQNLSYNDVLSKMAEEGIPKEILNEGEELLKDADKSDSLKKIAGNWIKELPFKVIEKTGEWALKNPTKLSEYQDTLMTWFNTL